MFISKRISSNQLHFHWQRRMVAFPVIHELHRTTCFVNIVKMSARKFKYYYYSTIAATSLFKVDVLHYYLFHIVICSNISHYLTLHSISRLQSIVELIAHLHSSRLLHCVVLQCLCFWFWLYSSSMLGVAQWAELLSRWVIDIANARTHMSSELEQMKIISFSHASSWLFFASKSYYSSCHRFPHDISLILHHIVIY